MSKKIEELSKNLAGGMSRRRALWRFVTGVGAVGGVGLLASKKAKAGTAVVETNCFQVFLNVYECCIAGGGSSFSSFSRLATNMASA